MTILTLIETGGTICMEAGVQGLRPAPDRVAAALRLLAPGLDIKVQALEPLVDSAEVGPALWNDLLDRIAAAPGPVIITHGTDTMAFTGAALDAALAGWGQSVVLCGSMRPLGVAGGDAEANLALALAAAQSGDPGVSLAFAGQILPAGAISKTDSQSDQAFEALGDLSPANPSLTRRYDPGRAVGVITLSPGLTPASLSAMLSGLDGAVLRVFGAGTLPATLADALASACARGCKITAISQCPRGGLAPGAYAAGAALWAAGVENGGQMSPEQALTRLWLRQSAPGGLS